MKTLGENLARYDGAGLEKRLEEERAERRALEARVRTLEVWRGWLLGGLGLAGSGAVVAVLKVFLMVPS